MATPNPPSKAAEPAPAWRRRTRGENPWPAAVAILLAIGAQLLLPDHLTLGARWLLPSIELVLVLALSLANPVRLVRDHPALRGTMLALVCLMTVANTASAVRLVDDLLNGKDVNSAAALFSTGGAIFLTNIVTFALWYWELDRGGPYARAAGIHRHPDFLFPQMTAPEMAPEDWEPYFIDYFYVSFTNAVAFSPTDTMPLTRWAKMLMLLQSAVALVTLGLVVARGVNVLT